ncbi:serine protease [Moritella sp. 28]|uniref:S1 family peptidase n=1 Tax=Moritella sp. 28 TaxID=2746232 RepID=UPI001BAE05B3|nr:serine protease [Moritella sp. 28]QUM86997.1 trypsin-like peptidase domain-containing protein [Moritella sp. 28]
MYTFNKLVVTIGVKTPSGTLTMLGSGFFVEATKIVTASHVIGNNHNELRMLVPNMDSCESIQDTTMTEVKAVRVEVIEFDPIRDIAILKIKDGEVSGTLPTLGSIDSVPVGGRVQIFGFPHCTDQRRVFTYQSAEVGAKVWLESYQVKSKYFILNIQARPGQSGSLIYYPDTHEIVGMLNGAYIPERKAMAVIADINLHELNQTTQCVSAEYIKEML